METSSIAKQQKLVPLLRPGATLLRGQYRIQSFLGAGGFGAIYRTTNSLGRHLVLKECFPEEFCERLGDCVKPRSKKLAPYVDAIKAQFALEAQLVARLEHPNLVSVHQIFEENGTLYMALSEVSGDDFVTLMEKTPERVTGDFARKITGQCLTALEFVHDHGVLHRDIAPDNLMVDANDHLTLIDFGAARQLDSERPATAYAVKDGYSPHELYAADGEHSFASDIYSLGASLYFLLSGSAPPSSLERLETLKASKNDPYVPLSGRDLPHDSQILKAIDRSLCVSQKMRFQTIEEWRKALGSSPPAATTRKSEIDLGPDFEAEIKLLVQSTNTQLKDAAPLDEPKPERPPKRETTAEERVVDIFGNPIDDVAAWLAEQDQDREGNTTASLPVPDVPEAATQHADAASTCKANQPEKMRRSLVGSLVSRCFARGESTSDPSELTEGTQDEIHQRYHQ